MQGFWSANNRYSYAVYDENVCARVISWCSVREVAIVYGKCEEKHYVNIECGTMAAHHVIIRTFHLWLRSWADNIHCTVLVACWWPVCLQCIASQLATVTCIIIDNLILVYFVIFRVFVQSSCTVDCMYRMCNYHSFFVISLLVVNVSLSFACIVTDETLQCVWINEHSKLLSSLARSANLPTQRYIFHHSTYWHYKTNSNIASPIQ